MFGYTSVQQEGTTPPPHLKFLLTGKSDSHFPSARTQRRHCMHPKSAGVSMQVSATSSCMYSAQFGSSGLRPQGQVGVGQHASPILHCALCIVHYASSIVLLGHPSPIVNLVHGDPKLLHARGLNSLRPITAHTLNILRGRVRGRRTHLYQHPG